MRTDDNWIQTFSGRQFWPTDPRPEDIDIVDIAHALAMKCRYTGHCREFYSVAQHCVIGSRHTGAKNALWFLLHDAPEAYLFDAARPIKAELPQIRELEARLMECIAAKLNLQLPEPGEVRHMDLVMLATERRDLMASPPRPWRSTAGIATLTETLEPWSWRRAEAEYLARFQDLTETKEITP